MPILTPSPPSNHITILAPLIRHLYDVDALTPARLLGRSRHRGLLCAQWQLNLPVIIFPNGDFKRFHLRVERNSYSLSRLHRKQCCSLYARCRRNTYAHEGHAGCEHPGTDERMLLYLHLYLSHTETDWLLQIPLAQQNPDVIAPPTTDHGDVYGLPRIPLLVRSLML